MRTDASESASLGQIVARKLNAATGPVAVLIPLQGFSALDRENQPFYDPQANAAFVESLESHLSHAIGLRKLPYHINESGFADEVVSTLASMMAGRKN